MVKKDSESLIDKCISYDYGEIDKHKQITKLYKGNTTKSKVEFYYKDLYKKCTLTMYKPIFFLTTLMTIKNISTDILFYWLMKIIQNCIENEIKKKIPLNNRYCLETYFTVSGSLTWEDLIEEDVEENCMWQFLGEIAASECVEKHGKQFLNFIIQKHESVYPEYGTRYGIMDILSNIITPKY